ncbi:MAG TPA: hypothetical protein VNA88_05575 [Candidatus Kapabacteria bacterium]|nr:hypothetical protein [Candidatus Kapabacteria bacterium]
MKHDLDDNGRDRRDDDGLDSTQGADWWRQMLTRRQAGARLAKLTAAALVLPSLGAVTGCGGDEEEIVESDALELQKADGWNVGSESKALAITGRSATDSQGGSAWQSHKTPATLLKDWSASDARWQPFVVPTLVQSLSQSTLGSGIAPVHTTSMDEAYRRGLGMREIIAASKDPAGMVIVSDLAGPESVAFAAALSDVADPVITFDNWPHPDGVVAAQQTLGALLYYADEVSKKSQARAAAATAAGGKVPAVFVLDSARLTEPAAGSTTAFDNRYLAKLPEASTLKSNGVTSVLYTTPDATRTQELDDLNEYFADYGDNGMKVQMLSMSDFKPDTSAAAARAQDTTRTTSRGYSGGYHHSPYYYGGGLAYVPLFFYTYPMYAYGRGAMPAYGRYSNVSVSRPSYTPSRRSTLFSSRTSGGGAGVGRTRPSSFGRVSRTTTSGGRGSFGGSRSSGSYGRSRGGGSM